MISLVLTVPGLVQPSPAQRRVTALTHPNGSVVYTNLASYNEIPSRSSLDILIDDISMQHGVDPGLVRSVIEVESNFDGRAVSRRGALGLMQLIPATGRRFGVRNFFDPAENINGGVRYLRFLLDMFDGNVDLSLAAYNSGENRVARLGRIPSIRETQEYVRKVNAVYNRRTAQRTSGLTDTSRAGTALSALSISSDTAQMEVGRPGSRPISSRIDERGVLRFSNVE
jgi:soluble lytic murein transglycosylase-like protein